jgi:hypothetical protein
MSADLRIELGAMLDEYADGRRAAEARKQHLHEEQAAFLAQFAKLRREVLRPVFEAAGEVLRDRGHAFEIREAEFASEGGSSTEAMITFRVTPAGMEAVAAADEHLRELSFTTRHYNRAVSIANGAVPHSGSLAGAQGARALADISTQLVEEELLKLMAALLRR